jgi:cytochrome c556
MRFIQRKALNFSKPLFIKITGLTFLCIVAGVQAADTAGLIEMRQQSFKKMGGAMKAINEELKADEADNSRIKNSADILVEKASLLHTWFPAGSGQESGLETDALDFIWKKTEKFSDASKVLVAETETLKNLSVGSDYSALKTQLKAVKDACSNCHKSFRAD